MLEPPNMNMDYSGSKSVFLIPILVKNPRFDKEEMVGAKNWYHQSIRNRKLLLVTYYEPSTMTGSQQGTV